MKSLQEIATLDPKAQDLLEAAGYFTIGSLKEHTLNQITDEMVKANRVLEIVDRDPDVDLVQQWLLPLKDELGELEVIKADPVDLVNERELLATSFAIPLSKSFIQANDIEVEQLLSGRVRYIAEEDALAQATTVTNVETTEVAEVAEVAVEEVSEAVAKTQPEASDKSEKAPLTPREELADKLENSIEEVAPEPDPEPEIPMAHENNVDEAIDELVNDLFNSKLETSIDKKRILSMDTFRAEGSRVEPLKSAAADDLTRSARKQTNEGKDPSSKRFVRGVLHKGAASFIGSLLAYLFFVACMLAGILVPILAILDKEKYSWAVFALVLIPIGLFVFFTGTGKASCPICNQKQFRPKRCLKHRNAHHFPLLGYMLPTALHALFFRWFRCIFCGTSVRLKE